MLLFGTLFNLIPWMICDMTLYAIMVYSCLQPVFYLVFGRDYEAVLAEVLIAFFR